MDLQTVNHFRKNVPCEKGSGYSNNGNSDYGYSGGTTSQNQALQKARSYLNAMAFSYEGLIDQLEYEGFTYSQAVYGVNAVGL